MSAFIQPTTVPFSSPFFSTTITTPTTTGTSPSSPSRRPRRPRHPVRSPLLTLPSPAAATAPASASATPAPDRAVLPTLSGLSSYLSHLPPSRRSLTVALFTTSGCRACRLALRRVGAVAAAYAAYPRLRFVAIDLSEPANAPVGLRLNLHAVPWVHCYVRKGPRVGLLEQGPLAPHRTAAEWVRRRVEWFVNEGFDDSEWEF